MTSVTFHSSSITSAINWLSSGIKAWPFPRLQPLTILSLCPLIEECPFVSSIPRLSRMIPPFLRLKSSTLTKSLPSKIVYQTTIHRSLTYDNFKSIELARKFFSHRLFYSLQNTSHRSRRDRNQVSLLRVISFASTDSQHSSVVHTVYKQQDYSRSRHRVSEAR